MRIMTIFFSTIVRQVNETVRVKLSTYERKDWKQTEPLNLIFQEYSTQTVVVQSLHIEKHNWKQVTYA